MDANAEFDLAKIDLFELPEYDKAQSNSFVGKSGIEHRNPFASMKIADNSFLNSIDGRQLCRRCHRSRKFFCYSCYLPVDVLQGRLPRIQLPVKIDIIKHKKETDGKSTAIHAAILAPDDVTIYTYPDIPDYEPDETTVLIFPSNSCTSIGAVFENPKWLPRVNPEVPRKGPPRATLLRHRLEAEAVNDGNNNEESSILPRYTRENLPIRRAILIDSTWNQTRSIYKDPRINRLRAVVIQHRLSQFWRHQKNSPRWYLGTIEALHQFLIEVHLNAWKCSRFYQGFEPLEVDMEFVNDHLETEEDTNDDTDDDALAPYNGQYDNLFFFFSHMYELIHNYYDHNDLKAYRRPIS